MRCADSGVSMNPATSLFGLPGARPFDTNLLVRLCPYPIFHGHTWQPVRLFPAEPRSLRRHRPRQHRPGTPTHRRCSPDDSPIPVRSFPAGFHAPFSVNTAGPSRWQFHHYLLMLRLLLRRRHPDFSTQEYCRNRLNRYLFLQRRPGQQLCPV